MSSYESIYASLHKLMAEGMTAEQAADAVLFGISRAELVSLVRPLVLMQARRYERSDTRRVERLVDAEIAKGTDPVTARSDLSKYEFPLPGGGRVKWLDATVEQHRLRAEWQRRSADSLVADAESHEEAIKDILNAGVTCLRDLQSPKRSGRPRISKSTKAVSSKPSTKVVMPKTARPRRKSA